MGWPSIRSHPAFQWAGFIPVVVRPLSSFRGRDGVQKPLSTAAHAQLIMPLVMSRSVNTSCAAGTPVAGSSALVCTSPSCLFFLFFFTGRCFAMASVSSVPAAAVAAVRGARRVVVSGSRSGSCAPGFLPLLVGLPCSGLRGVCPWGRCGCAVRVALCPCAGVPGGCVWLGAGGICSSLHCLGALGWLGARASLFVCFPGGPCPAGLVPSPSPAACFCGLGSGSWASLALALGLGVPALVWLPPGVAPSSCWGVPVPWLGLVLSLAHGVGLLTQKNRRATPTYIKKNYRHSNSAVTKPRWCQIESD